MIARISPPSSLAVGKQWRQQRAAREDQRTRSADMHLIVAPQRVGSLLCLQLYHAAVGAQQLLSSTTGVAQGCNCCALVGGEADSARAPVVGAQPRTRRNGRHWCRMVKG